MYHPAGKRFGLHVVAGVDAFKKHLQGAGIGVKPAKPVVALPENKVIYPPYSLPQEGSV